MSATVVADQLNLAHVQAESKYTGFPIDVTVHFDHNCVVHAGPRTVGGLQPPLQ